MTAKFGTGRQIGDIPVGQAASKEVVDFGENIGYHVDEKTKVKTPTTKGTVHYSKKGAHIVPTHPSSDAGK